MLEWEELRETVFPTSSIREGEVRKNRLKNSGDLIKRYIENPNAVNVVRDQLNGKDWRLALEVASYLDVESKKQLFPEIFRWTMSEMVALLAINIIKSLPKDWVMPRLETEVKKNLGDVADDYDYKIILSFIRDYAPDLAFQVANRALSHSDEYVREAGEDAKRYLSTAS